MWFVMELLLVGVDAVCLCWLIRSSRGRSVKQGVVAHLKTVRNIEHLVISPLAFIVKWYGRICGTALHVGIPCDR